MNDNTIIEMKDFNGDVLTLGDIVSYRSFLTGKIVVGVVRNFTVSQSPEVTVELLTKFKGNPVVIRGVGSKRTVVVADTLQPQKLVIISENDVYKEYPVEWLEEIFANPGNIQNFVKHTPVNKLNVFSNIIKINKNDSGK